MAILVQGLPTTLFVSVWEYFLLHSAYRFLVHGGAIEKLPLNNMGIRILK